MQNTRSRITIYTTFRISKEKEANKNMLIKAQSRDEQRLVNINNMTDIKTNSGQINIYYKNRCIQLGMYSSPEKAAKVMDMLEEAYRQDRCLIPLEKPDDSVWQVILSQPVVFHMPQDDEVEV